MVRVEEGLSYHTLVEVDKGGEHHVELAEVESQLASPISLVGPIHDERHLLFTLW